MDRRKILSGMAFASLSAVPQLSAQAKGPAATRPVPTRLSWNVREYGARGDGKTNDMAAIQRAIDACAAHGGGRVLLPSNFTFYSGAIHLKSNVDLHLEPGTRLLACKERHAYGSAGSLIFAKDAQNISITGTGTIDGNGLFFQGPLGEGGFEVTPAFLGDYNPLDPTVDAEHGRPRMIVLVQCKRVQISDILITMAPTWTIHPIGCDDVDIDGISIINDLRVPNCDGIDVDHCRNVRIANCNIQAGDDCLIVKASRNFVDMGPCENVTITGCTLYSSSAGVKIEPEGPDTVRATVISACTIHRSNRGICILNRDGAILEDILVSDLIIGTEMRHTMWWGVGEPIHVSNIPRHSDSKIGRIRNLRFHNILCKGENGIYLRGWPGFPLEEFVFDDVRLFIEKTSKWEGGYYDARPGTVFQGLYKHQLAGFFGEYVRDLELRNIKVVWGENLPDYYGAALELNQVEEPLVQNFRGASAHPEKTPARLRDGKEWAD